MRAVSVAECWRGYAHVRGARRREFARPRSQTVVCGGREGVASQNLRFVWLKED